ncbi:TonB-dependent receptor PqqU [soil metagenome]
MNHQYLMRPLPLLLLLCLPVFLAPSLALAQIDLSGRVLDAQSRTVLPGVSIYTPGGAGTTTGADGRFQLSLPAGGPVTFSYLGYGTRTLSVNQSQTDLAVLLEPSTQHFGEVVVTGYENNRPLLQTAGSIGGLSTRDLRRFNETSLAPAFNMLPGVRMDERATASYRISIRGSTLRAPFGVRNVKVYLNEIPFTDASGNTSLNLIDVASLGRVEVIKGPAGSVYGAGIGGAVILETERPRPGESGAEVGLMAGSYGLRRYTATVRTGSEKGGMMMQYANQRLDGYREQSAMDRHMLTLSGRLEASEKRTLFLNAFYTDLYYELPGGLTRQQYDDNPRQARLDVVNAQGVVTAPGSVTQNASMEVEALNIGLAQRYRFSDRWSNTTALYGTFSNMDHPFVTDYKRNSDQGLGGRTRTVYTTALGGLPAKFTLGGEYQRGFEVARSFDNNRGRLGRLRFDDEIRAIQSVVFGQAEVDLPGGLIATLGASYNSLHYLITRVSDASVTDQLTRTRDFSPVLSPRLALLKTLTPDISVHASISNGFSPPTQGEVRTNDGQINTSLEPEKGTNYELGMRGNVLRQRLSFDLTAFSLRLRETIIGSTGASTVVTFSNSGATRQDGLEAALSYAVIQNDQRFLSLLKGWGSYTYNRFRFQEYLRGVEDLSGNAVTGVAPHTLTAGLDLESRLGLYLNVTSNYIDRIPLNDQNTVYADEYLIFGARGGFRRVLLQRISAEVYGGVDNLTDRHYSLGNDLNVQFGNRFFQPAPGRNYYGGVTAKYLF